MNVVLLGPQGSGKGTQAALLCKKYGFYYFEAGEFLRMLAKDNKDLEKMMVQGKLVPDEETSSSVASFLDSQNLYDEILFDGFPRTTGQYRVFRNWLLDKDVKLELFLVLEIPEEESIKRLSARRMNPKTGKIYNLITDPPPKGIGINSLVQRGDDRPEAIKKRLEIYRSKTVDLINEIKKHTKVVEVDGARPIEIVFKDLSHIIDQQYL